MQKETRQFTKKAEEMGWIVEFTKGNHVKCTHPVTGGLVYASSTPSCSRSLRNALSQLKRYGKPKNG